MAELPRRIDSLGPGQKWQTRRQRSTNHTIWASAPWTLKCTCLWQHKNVRNDLTFGFTGCQLNALSPPYLGTSVHSTYVSMAQDLITYFTHMDICINPGFRRKLSEFITSTGSWGNPTQTHLKGTITSSFVGRYVLFYLVVHVWNRRTY